MRLTQLIDSLNKPANSRPAADPGGAPDDHDHVIDEG